MIPILLFISRKALHYLLTKQQVLRNKTISGYLRSNVS